MSEETLNKEMNDTEAPEKTDNAGNKKAGSDVKKEIREWIYSIAFALMIVFFIRTFLFQIIRVDGESMYPTLENNERLFVPVLDVRISGIDRNDIVICHYPNRGTTNFVKRAVAVPGDTVYRKNGVTHVEYVENGESFDVALDERYSAYYPNGSSTDYEAYTLGENEYFMVGDNRYNSHDSRDWKDNNSTNDVGPITYDMIVGRVSTIIWPFSDIGSPYKD